MTMKGLLLVTLAVSCAATEENPLGRVLGLMSDLSAKVTADGEAEMKAYRKYFSWCDDAANDGTNEISTLTSNTEKNNADILELTATIEADTSAIDQLASALAEANAELAKAEKLHKDETDEFKANEKELVGVVDTIGRAISILSREMQKNPAAFNQIKAATNAASLVQSLAAIADAASFNTMDRQTLLNLAQTHSSSESDDSDPGAPAAAVYKSHSTGIFDLLEDLKDKAEVELSDARKEYATAKHNYQMLKQSLEDQKEADEADMKETKASKSAAEESLAVATEDLKVNENLLKTTKDTLATTQNNCMQVAADHEATVAARNEELKVIAEATEILKSSTGGAVEQSYSFIQLSSRSDLAGTEVVALVKKLADAQHSRSLAQLASRITATIKFGTGGDVFKKVRGLIRDMINKLETEAKEDATEKAYCDEETAKTKAKDAELQATIDKLNAKINKAAARSTQLKADVQELQASLAKLAKEQNEMDTIRAEENADYKKAKADLEAGLTGIRAALTKLRDYYGSKGALVQESMTEMMQQPAKPAHHKKAGGAGGGIIGILEVCESDFANDLAKEESQESDRADAYEKQTQQNKLQKAEQSQDVKYKTKESTGLDKDIRDLTGDRDTSATEQGAVKEYLEKLNDRCVAKPETYESRKARRDAEIKGLKEGLEILNSVGFVQKKHKLRGAIVN